MDEGEAGTEAAGERAVGRRPVADDGRDRPQDFEGELGGRTVRLAGDDRLGHVYIHDSDGFGEVGAAPAGEASPGFGVAQQALWGFELHDDPVQRASEQTIL